MSFLKEINESIIFDFQEKILNWFKVNQRDLPWRKNFLPYEIWISEMMLQQTQVKKVLSYYIEFMKRFPNIKILSESTEDEILKVWKGLGYYKRAKYILRTAKIIQNEYQGSFPESYESLISLPGIGRYTGGAILSIAFNKAYPILDGNIKRILKRWLAIESPWNSALEKEMWNFQKTLIPKENPRHFNQAMMELGALICSPKNPKCDVCVLSKNCKGFQNKNLDFIFVSQKRKIIEKKYFIYLILKNKKDEFIIHKRNKKQLLSLMWDFPYFEISSFKKDPFSTLIKKIQSQKTSNSNHFDFWTYKNKIEHKITRYHLSSFIYFLFEKDCPSLSFLKNLEWLENFFEKEKISYKWIPSNELKEYFYNSLSLKISQLFL